MNLSQLEAILAREYMLEIVVVILATLLIIAVAWLIRTEIKMRRILRGKNARTLDDTIAHLDTALQKIERDHGALKKDFDQLVPQVRESIRGVHTVRFNPFNRTGAGGNQSFAVSFLNEHGDGVVLSSLYTRERVSVYAKPVSRFKSEFELTKEEREAIAKAKLS